VATFATRMTFGIKTINNGYDVEDGDLVVTGVISFILLELHLALLAAYLPTIRCLFKGLSPESVLSSLQSALSLHSLRSNRSRIYDDETRQGGTTTRAEAIVLAEQGREREEGHRKEGSKV
jgi:hypothetical protein